MNPAFARRVLMKTQVQLRYHPVFPADSEELWQWLTPEDVKAMYVDGSISLEELEEGLDKVLVA